MTNKRTGAFIQLLETTNQLIMKYLSFLLVTILSSTSLLAQDGKFADVNGIRMYYESYGEGEPLFLLHYWTSTSQMWKEHVEDLKLEYKVYIPDLRGHGKSEADLSDFTMKESAKDLMALMNHLNLDKIKAIGVSYGGFTLLHAATMEPERIEAMVLVGTAPYLSTGAREYISGFDWETANPSFVERLIAQHGNDENRAEQIFQTFASFKDDYMMINFTPPLLSTIKAETLIVMGENDYLGLDLAVEMSKSIANSHLWIVPNTGHTGPVFGKNQAEFIRVSKEFLNGAWSE